MKLLVLVVFVAFIGLTFANHGIHLNEEQQKKVHGFSVECIEKEKTTPEATKGLKTGAFPHDDKNLKCFTNCFLEKTGMFVDGALKDDIVKAKLGPLVGDDKLKEIMTKCGPLKGDDKCDTAFKLSECFYNNKLGIV